MAWAVYIADWDVEFNCHSVTISVVHVVRDDVLGSVTLALQVEVDEPVFVRVEQYFAEGLCIVGGILIPLDGVCQVRSERLEDRSSHTFANICSVDNRHSYY